MWQIKPPRGSKPIPGRQGMKGCVGLWLMNEGTGNEVYDLSGNGNDGTINGATWGPGRDGPALDFDGDDYVDCGNNPSLQLTGPSSFFAWVKTTVDNEANFILSKSGAAGNRGIELFQLNDAFYTRGSLDGTAFTASVIGSTFSMNEWYFVGCVMDGSQLHLYINGVEEGTPVTLASHYNSAQNFEIARGENNSGYAWKGTIGDIFAFNRALSAQEIWQLRREPYCMFAVQEMVQYFFIGGIAYTLTPSDSVSIAESVVKGMGLFDAENLALAEAVGKGVGLFGVENLSLADVVSRAAAFVRAAAEYLTLADSPSKAIGLVDADSLTISDAVVLGAAFARAVSESLSVSDAAVKAVGRSDADSVALAEVAVKGVGLLRSDAVSLSDAVAHVVAFVRSVADSVGITDSVVLAGAWTYALIFAESVGITDAVAKVVGSAQGDNVVLADAVAKLFGLSSSDALTIVDVAVKAAGAGVSDSVGLADAVSKAVGLVKTDSEPITDAAIVTLLAFLIITSVLLQPTVGIDDITLDTMIDDILLN